MEESTTFNGKDGIYALFGRHTTLIPLVSHTKRPAFKGWNFVTYEETMRQEYQAQLRQGGIGVLLGPESGHLIDIDIDDEDALQDFEKLNPALVRQALQTCGSKGRHFFARIPDGRYPHLIEWRHQTKVDAERKPLHLAEFRSITNSEKDGRFAGCQTMVYGIHPKTGKPYHILNRVSPPEILYSDIKWPSYFTGDHRRNNTERNNAKKDDVESLRNLPLYAARKQIADQLFSGINWLSGTHGELICPHANLHSSATAERHTFVYVDGVPTVHCLHESCKEALEETNRKFRFRVFEQLSIDLPNGFHDWSASADVLFKQLEQFK